MFQYINECDKSCVRYERIEDVYVAVQWRMTTVM